MASWPPFDKWTRPCISNTPLFCVFRLSPETRERVQTLCIGCKGYIFRTQSFRMLQTLPSKVTFFLWGVKLKNSSQSFFLHCRSGYCQTFSFRYNDNNRATNNCLLSDRRSFNVSFYIIFQFLWNNGSDFLHRFTVKIG